MNEAEKHYGGIDAPGADRPAGGSAPSSMVSSARERVSEGYERASDWARERYDDAADWASERYEDASRNARYARRRSVAQLSRGRDSVERFVDDNPIMIGVAGLAAGLLIGALLPGTRRENAAFGRYADEVRDQGLRYAQSLAEEGRQLVDEQLGRLPQGRDRDLGDETTAR